MDVFTLSAKLLLNTTEFNSGMAAAETKMSSWGVTLGNLAAQAVTKGVRAITNFGKSVVSTGMDFESAMSEVKKIRTEATEEQFDELSKKAQELGASTKFTASEVAEAFYYMAVAGWHTDEMLDGIEGVLNLAAASGESLGQTSDIVTDALTAMGYEAKDTGRFVDVLAAAAANSNTTVGMMGEAFKYLATTGGVLEYSIEDVATVLGLLANNGIKASQAGTSMRQILNTLINPSDKAAEAMKNLGISLFDPQTNARKPLGQVLQELRDVFKDAGLQLEEGFDAGEIQERLDKLNTWYDEEYAKIEQMTSGKKKALKELDSQYQQRFTEEITPNQSFLQKIGDIGGLRGISSLLAIMKSTDEDFDQLVTSVENSNGAAQTMAETALDNLKGDVTILNSAIDGLKILVSEDFTTQFRAFVKTLTEGVGEISKGFKEGGLVGMFTNLANWVIDGITSALTDESITGEGAQDFGRALGDFVGNLVAKLVTSAPELISGLFNAGMNLAGGLIQGLFEGLFGTGSGTVYGLISNVEDEKDDAIQEAEKTATKATGIVNYMDSLVEKYGEAASNTTEWATALEKLEQVLPGITSEINGQTTAASAATEAMRAYIDGNKELAIEQAKQAALEKYQQAYNEALENLGTEEINAAISKSQADAALGELISYAVNEQLDRMGLEGEERTQKQSELTEQWKNSFDKNFDDAYARLENIIAPLFFDDETATRIEALQKTYDEQNKAYKESTGKTDSLSAAAEALKLQLDIAKSAFEHAASEMNSVTAPTFSGDGSEEPQHAKGAWNIPYDDYHARLHRGEMVLTASQARRYRDGSDINMSSLAQTIANAVRDSMANVSVRSYLNGKDITDEVSRNMGNSMKSRRFAT